MIVSSAPAVSPAWVMLTCIMLKASGWAIIASDNDSPEVTRATRSSTSSRTPAWSACSPTTCKRTDQREPGGEPDRELPQQRDAVRRLDACVRR